jgi:hypothetical protein
VFYITFYELNKLWLHNGIVKNLTQVMLGSALSWLRQS